MFFGKASRCMLEVVRPKMPTLTPATSLTIQGWTHGTGLLSAPKVLADRTGIFIFPIKDRMASPPSSYSWLPITIAS